MRKLLLLLSLLPCVQVYARTDIRKNIHKNIIDTVSPLLLASRELDAAKQQCVQEVIHSMGMDDWNISCYWMNEICDAKFGNVNVFTLGNGIFFGSRVFELYTPSTLRFVIAHELGHCKKYHGQKRLLRAALGVGALGGLHFTLYKTAYSKEHKLRSWVIGLASHAAAVGLLRGVNAHWAKQEEFEADLVAAQTLEAYDDACECFKFLNPYAAKHGAIGKVFASHPTFDERIEAIQQAKLQRVVPLIAR